MRKTVEWIIDNVLTDDQKQTLYSHCLKFAYLYDSSKKTQKSLASVMNLTKNNSNLVLKCIV